MSGAAVVKLLSYVIKQASFQVFILLLFTAPAYAVAGCGWNADHSFWGCDDVFSGAPAGGSAPPLGDSLESNPAAIPSRPTPFGLEGTYSNRSAPGGKPKFFGSTIKGFEGIGFGIGSWSEGTFGAPDFPNHFLTSSAQAAYQQYQIHPPSTLGFRLGSSLVLPKALFPKKIRVSIGGSAGKGRTHGTWSPQAGVLISFFSLGLGYSHSYERISPALPTITIATFSVGIPVGPLYLGYSYITLCSSVNKTYANAYSLRLIRNAWTLYGNIKFQKDHRGAPDTWYRGGIQRRFGSRFGLGYEYGLYRYSHSASLQIYL